MQPEPEANLYVWLSLSECGKQFESWALFLSHRLKLAYVMWPTRLIPTLALFDRKFAMIRRCSAPGWRESRLFFAPLSEDPGAEVPKRE